jgi:hypothetical protein
MSILVAFWVLGAGCTSTGAAEEFRGPIGPHAVVVEFAVDRGHGEDTDLVWVVEPAPGLWDQWCGREGDFVPCHALQAMTIDLGARFPSDVATEIEAAFAPRRVEFVADASDVILPPALYPEVKDGGGFLAFGRSIDVDDKIYLPVDGLGEGWLFELTPTAEGWDLDVLVTWMA